MGEFLNQPEAGRGAHVQWVRVLAYTVAFFLLCTIVGSIGIGFRISDGFTQVQQGWNAYTAAIEPRSRALDQLRSGFSFRGLPAGYRLYTQNRSPQVLAALQKQFSATQDALLAYESIDTTDTENLVLGALRGALNRYAEALEAAASVSAAGIPDDALTSDDAGAVIAALETLERERERAVSRATDRMDATVALGFNVVNRGALILPVLVIAGLMLIWLLRRLVQETTTRTHAEEVLRDSEERYRDLYDNAPNAYFTVAAADGKIVRANAALARMLGRSATELSGKSVFENVAEEPDGLVAAKLAFERIGHGETIANLELPMKHGAGRTIWTSLTAEPLRNAYGKVAEVRCVMTDISDRRRAEDEIRTVQEELVRRANYDALTSLPNRTLLLDRLSQALIRAHRQGDKVAVMFVDLDRFKHINDTYGHEAGDKLLQEAARRLRACVREGDTVARLAGDEFVIVLSAVSTLADAAVVAAKVIARFSEPFKVEQAEETVSSSVGIAVYPEDGANLHVLLRNADTAMYAAKQGGRNRFSFYRPQQAEVPEGAEAIGTNIQRALDSGELSLDFQPILETRSRRVVGAEALLRWRSPVLGVVDPMQFIPVAEEKGAIVAIGEWVLNEGCRNLRLWQGSPGGADVALSVNISSRQVAGGHLQNSVTRALSAAGLKAGALEIELTEDLLQEIGPETLGVLTRLGEIGVRLCIEDFGLTPSSLIDLKRYPFTTLKIDRALVGAIATDPTRASLAQAVIQMGHTLGLTVTAEGVETQAQLDFLTTHFCDHVQGNFFSAPLNAEEFAAFLKGKS
jgi:diguanylate cyclase (GGDEF)-like protein/PAS domain S-box-containing protein